MIKLRFIVSSLACLLLPFVALGQISTAEYFFDTDPGVGNATTIAVTSYNADSAEIAGQIQVPTSLAPGAHKVFVRFAKVIAGAPKWGLTQEQAFYILSNGASITALEYYFDADPGVGNGIALPLTTQNDTAIYLGKISTAGLNFGAHKVFVRGRNLYGSWGLVDMQPFFINQSGAVIAGGEYFFDTDPGVGNGIAIALNAAADSAVFNGNISTAGLPGGKHVLYVRTRDFSGRYSATEAKHFFINTTPILAEYFVDTDPGVGAGTPINLTLTTAGTAEYTGNIAIPTSVGTGTHKLYVRALDNAGQWGLVDSQGFTILCDKWFRDFDNDGYGNINDTLRTCVQPNGYVNNGLDCNDNNALEKPGQLWYVDADGDDYGIAPAIASCTRPPNAFAASELIASTTDCNDNAATAYPGATEICDGIDNDCDGAVDEGLLFTYYFDGDNDGYGVVSTTTIACSAPANYVALSGDCNDGNAAINPLATEVCDGIDNNCNGQTDEALLTNYYPDIDGDGFGNTAAVLAACTQPSGYITTAGDCNDNNSLINPLATEVCDNVDNDCDGLIDEGVTTVFYRDFDGDGFGNATNTINACSQPSGYVSNSTDCNDNAATVYPGAVEICDGLDNDCDGDIDAADANVVLNTYYADSDGDSYGNINNTQQACTAPVGHVSNSTDCNDANANEYPSQVWYIDADGDGYGTGATIIQCLQPANAYLPSSLDSIAGDCNDNNPAIKPNSQYFTFSSGVYANAVVSPLQGSTYTTFTFEVMYVDSSNAMPPASYPRAILDFEANGVYTGASDRTILLSAADVSDSITSDGKKYIGTINALPIGANYQTIIQTNVQSCAVNFGPFNYPDVVVYPDLQIFANDITFSTSNPSTGSPLTVFATIHNVSDFPGNNFVVHLRNQYDTTLVYPDITVATIAPHSSMQVSWNITTPSVPSWCPMQVYVDYANAIPETNELDNTAVRPFVNGNYNLPGRIVVTAEVTPQVSTTIANFNLTLSGKAHYSGVAVPLLDSSVAGATVSASIVETGAQFTGYTNSQGNYAMSFPKPLNPGLYHMQVHVTDYTLDGDTTTTFTIVYVAPPCFADITASIALSPHTSYAGFSSNTIFVGDSVSGTITITNNGCFTTGTAMYTAVSQTGGSLSIPSFTVPALAPGASYSVGFSNIVYNTIGTAAITVQADAYNVVNELNESNNGTVALINVISPLPDLSSTLGSNGYYSECNLPTSVSFTVVNGGGSPAFGVNCKLYRSKNGVLVDSVIHTIAVVAANSYSSVSIPFSYDAGLNYYTYALQADYTNSIAELNESNNNSGVIFTATACKPDLVIGGCMAVDVASSNAQYSGTLTVTATIGNVGNAAITTPIDVVFNLSGGTSYTVIHTGGLAAGANATVSTTITAPPPATQTISATVDPTNAYNEFSEGNNMAVGNMCVDLFPAALCYGVNFWDIVYIKNQAAVPYLALGTANLYTAQNVAVNVSVSGPGISGMQDLGNIIVPSATQNCICPLMISAANTFVFANAGIYTFTFTVDANNAYTECNESNNVMVRTVTVLEQPDMRILSQYINPSLLNPNVGQAVTFDISYDNVGVQNIADTMELMLRVNNTNIDSAQVFGLTTNDNNTHHFATTWSSTIPGVHIVRAIIDHDAEVVELNELNNEATRAIIVGELPNMYFKKIFATNVVPNIGDQIAITGNVGNSGDSYAEADVRFSYIDNANDTILIGLTHVQVPANDSVIFNMPWTVADAKTNIIAEIINTTSLEATYDDNDSVIVLGNMIVSASVIPACDTLANGIAIANAAGGDAPYTYQWQTGLVNDSIIGAAGSYTVVATDVFGQTASTVVAINALARPTVSANATPTSVLVGNSAVLLASGASTYTWANAATLSATIGAMVSAQPAVTTIYTVTGASNYGCTNTATVTLTIIPLVQMDSAHSTAPSCATSSNGSIIVFASGGIAPISYALLPNTGLQTSPGVFSNLTAGTYTCTVTDATMATTTTIVSISAANTFSVTITASTTTVNTQDMLALSVSGNEPIASAVWNAPGGLSAVGTTFNAQVFAVNSGIYTVQATSINGCIANSTISITVIDRPIIAAKVLLNGPYLTAMLAMTDSLRQKNLIPLTQPYGAAPYNQGVAHTGTETISSSVLSASGNNAIVDWVLLELRHATTPTVVVATRAALLQRDGDVVDVDGISPVYFSTALAGNYFVAIRHRNHLGIMTAAALPINDMVATLDFTESSTALYTKSSPLHNPSPATGATRQVGMKRTLYAGNCNLSSASTASIVTYNSASISDRAALLAAVPGTATLNGYTQYDCDLNGFARFNGLLPDRLVILQNCFNSTTLVVREQLP